MLNVLENWFSERLSISLHCHFYKYKLNYHCLLLRGERFKTSPTYLVALAFWSNFLIKSNSINLYFFKFMPKKKKEFKISLTSLLSTMHTYTAILYLHLKYATKFLCFFFTEHCSVYIIPVHIYKYVCVCEYKNINWVND